MSLRDIMVPKQTANKCQDLVYLPALEEYKKDARFQNSDYAIVCGLPSKKEHYVLTRTATSYGLMCYSNQSDSQRSIEADSKFKCIQPAFQLNAEFFNESTVGKYAIVSNKAKGFVEFEEFVFPQTIAEDSEKMEKEFLADDSNFVPTVHSFSGYMKDDYSLVQNPEYLYKGQRYVRAKAKRGDERNFSDNTGCLADHYYWFKVEPVRFMIENWKYLPKSVNPYGTGRDKEIKLHSAAPLIAGVPFYISESDNKWQNSILRAYFNSYDLKTTLETGNGDIKLKGRVNFDFSGGGFLEEVFSDRVAVNEKANDRKLSNNPYGVTIDNAPLTVKEQMKFYINEGMSFMLHGPSGVGKTRRVQELDPNCVCLQLRNGILPEEIIGKTGFENGKSFWIEPTWYTRLCEVCKNDPEHNHVLFIDEVTNVRPNEQSLIFHLVLSRSIDGSVGKLPDNCVVVAAGNDPKESEAAYNMPEPLFRRFDGHIELKPDVRSFLEWGSELRPDGNPKIHPLVAAFVAANDKKVFYSSYDPEKPPKFAIDPRGWEQVSNIIYANNGALRLNLLASKVGADIAVALINFARKAVISLEDIVEGNYSVNDIPKDLNGKFALTCSLRRANESQVRKVREFIGTNLGGENLSYFDSMWASDSDERALLIEQIQNENAEKLEQEMIKREAEKAGKSAKEGNDAFDRFRQSDIYKSILDL